MSNEPQGKAKCPGCNEVVFQDYRWENKQTGMVSCGWCGWNPETGEQACLVPASATPAASA